MANIPKEVLDLMAEQTTAKLIVSSTKDGVPHAIVAGSIGAPAPDTVIVGEVMMKKTAANLKANGNAEIVVVSGLKAYSIQVKVKTRLDKGAELEAMNKALAAMKLKAAAVWVFDVLSVYDQSAAASAGTKLA